MSAEIVREYFAALAARDASAPERFFAADGIDDLHGLSGPMSPAQASAFFAEVFEAFPDFRFEVLDLVAQDDRVVTRWGAKATFAGPGSFQGLAPNGARIAIEGADVMRVRDGRIVHNDAYLNGLDLLRQLGASPAAGSPSEQRMTSLINARNRLTAAATARALIGSSAAVGSSRIRIGAFLRIARATLRRCRSPPDRVPPAWAISV